MPYFRKAHLLCTETRIQFYTSSNDATLLQNSNSNPSYQQIQKGRSNRSRRGKMITHWISSNLPLRHESLGRRLQVPLQQIVVNIHIQPAPRAPEINPNPTGKKFTETSRRTRQNRS